MDSKTAEQVLICELHVPLGHCILGRVRSDMTFQDSKEKIPDQSPGEYRYLEREYLTNYRHSHIVLLRPTMSFMLMQTPDPRTIKVRACGRVGRSSVLDEERACSKNGSPLGRPARPHQCLPHLPTHQRQPLGHPCRGRYSLVPAPGLHRRRRRLPLRQHAPGKPGRGPPRDLETVAPRQQAAAFHPLERLSAAGQFE